MLNLHIIKLEDGRRILYFPKSMRFFTVNENQAEQYLQIAHDLSLDDDVPESFAKDEGYLYAAKLLSETANIEQGKFNTKILPRLVLNISNECNLRCKYCYAAGGSYSGERCLMDIDTLKAALNSFYSCFSEIESIQLFGGEPAMNVDAVEFVCNYIREHSYSTQIGIVTNGTILPDSQYICFAGFGTIAVSATGEVYPCFYFCENKDFLCCSVFDSFDVFCAAVSKMQGKYLAYNRYSNVSGYDIGIKSELLAAALAALPDRKRDIILLYHFFGLTDQEIGNLLHMLRATVQYQRTSTLQLLKEIMEGKING